LGLRETDIYGTLTLDQINDRLRQYAAAKGISVHPVQSNHEGELIDQLHHAQTTYQGVVFNPAGYTHTSVALRDAVAAIDLPVVEVHLSNISGREDFRRVSLIAPVCAGQISGFGWRSYLLGIEAVLGCLHEG